MSFTSSSSVSWVQGQDTEADEAQLHGWEERLQGIPAEACREAQLMRRQGCEVRGGCQGACEGCPCLVVEVVQEADERELHVEVGVGLQGLVGGGLQVGALHDEGGGDADDAGDERGIGVDAGAVQVLQGPHGPAQEAGAPVSYPIQPSPCLPLWRSLRTGSSLELPFACRYPDKHGSSGLSCTPLEEQEALSPRTALRRPS